MSGPIGNANKRQPSGNVNVKTIQVSQTNDRSSTSEYTDFKINLKKPIAINDGDSVEFFEAFLNVHSLTGSNIVLPEDLTIRMEFGYYTINGLQYADYTAVRDCKYYYSADFSQPTDNPAGPGNPTTYDLVTNSQVPVITDFGTYVFHTYDATSHKFTPVIGNFQMVIPAGSYTPSQLATMITQRCSSVNGESLQIVGSDVDPLMTRSGRDFLLNGGTEVYSTTGYWLDGYTSTTDMNTVRKFRLTADTQPQPPNANLPVPYIGTGQIALDFDPESLTFSWSYMHQPIEDPATGTPSVIVTRTTYTGVTPEPANFMSVLQTQTKQGGIFFTALEPKSFWESLGFSASGSIVDISDGISISEVIAKTSDNQLGLSTILSLSPNDSMIVNQNTADSVASSTPLFLYKYLTSTNILPLRSTSTYQASNSGFYLISADLGCPCSEYTNGEENYGTISAIASKQWLSNNIISIFPDSAIPYIHSGSSIYISSVHVRILNPDLTVPTDIKAGSTIFIRVVSAQ